MKNMLSEKSVPLYVASYAYSLDLTKKLPFLLIENGANLFYKDKISQSPFSLRCYGLARAETLKPSKVKKNISNLSRFHELLASAWKA